jgi:hypothetical protein
MWHCTSFSASSCIICESFYCLDPRKFAVVLEALAYVTPVGTAECMEPPVIRALNDIWIELSGKSEDVCCGAGM